MKTSRLLRRLGLVILVAALLCLAPIPASAMTCATRCGAYISKGVLCFTCCTCCVFSDGSADCVCTTDCSPL